MFSRSLYAILVVFELSNSNALIFSISFLIKILWLSSCLIFVVWEKAQLLKKNIIIKEYLNASNFFLDDSQTKYLNALLDDIAKKLRI